MCRYGINRYKAHYACFECRKTFKRKLLRDIDKDSICFEKLEEIPATCPECGELLLNMGLDFASPKKNDLKAWRHIENLYESGITFHSCGCSGPGYIPKDKFKLLEFLNEKREVFIEHRRFWSCRVEPQTQKEKSKDWDKNNHFLFSLPNEMKIGTRKNRRTDKLKAVAYWTKKIVDIETRIYKLVRTLGNKS